MVSDRKTYVSLTSDLSVFENNYFDMFLVKSMIFLYSSFVAEECRTHAFFFNMSASKNTHFLFTRANILKFGEKGRDYDSFCLNFWASTSMLISS